MAISSIAAFAAYAADAVARADRWTKEIGFEPGGPGMYTNDNCQMLGVDSLDFSHAQQGKTNRGKRSDFALRSGVDVLILNAVHPKAYCSSYSSFRFSEEGKAALRKAWAEH
jgi:hypothetical protein